MPPSSASTRRSCRWRRKRRNRSPASRALHLPHLFDSRSLRQASNPSRPRTWQARRCKPNRISAALPCSRPVSIPAVHRSLRRRDPQRLHRWSRPPPMCPLLHRRRRRVRRSTASNSRHRRHQAQRLAPFRKRRRRSIRVSPACPSAATTISAPMTFHWPWRRISMPARTSTRRRMETTRQPG